MLCLTSTGYCTLQPLLGISILLRAVASEIIMNIRRNPLSDDEFSVFLLGLGLSHRDQLHVVSDRYFLPSLQKRRGIRRPTFVTA